MTSGNGVEYTFDTFYTFLKQDRQIFTNRRLISSTYTVVPNDATGLTGTTGHVAIISAIMDGLAVIIKIDSVLQTKLDRKGNQVYTTETFALAVKDI